MTSRRIPAGATAAVAPAGVRACSGTSDAAGSGGGGGSFAVGNTTTDAAAPTATPTDPGSPSGAVRVTSHIP